MPYLSSSRLAALALSLALLPAAARAGAAELSCPPELEIEETPVGAAPWIASSGRRSVALAGVGIVNGVPGDERAEAPVILAPDEESSEGRRVTQTWHLAAYRDGGLLLVCRYGGSSAYLAAVLDQALTDCVVSFDAVPGADSTAYESFVATCR